MISTTSGKSDESDYLRPEAEKNLKTDVHSIVSHDLHAPTMESNHWPSVRLIRTMLQQLSSALGNHELGPDSTTQEEPSAASNTLGYRIYPRMTSEGQSVTTDVGELVAVDKLVSVSVSPSDRGSSDSGRVLAAKTAWRHPDRASEFVVHHHLRPLRVEGRPSISAFATGGDAALEGQTGGQAPVNVPRPQETHVTGDIALQRIVPATAGKPLWKYDSYQQFLRGLLAIIKGIRALSELGITHHDINAGNVLLSVNDPRPGYEGFVADFEFAYFSDELSETPQQSSGLTITGTIQFMALEILQYLVETHSSDATPTPVVHATHHDLESLVYVVVYAAYCRVYDESHATDSKMTATERQLFQADFEKFFGRASVADVRSSRVGLITRMNAGEPREDNVFRHLPFPIQAMCNVLLDAVRAQNPDSAHSTYTQEQAAEPQMAYLIQRFPNLFVVGNQGPPIKHLTCQTMEELAQGFVTVYCSQVAPAGGRVA